MSSPDDLDRLSHTELKGLVVRQWEQMVELQRMVAALRDEIDVRWQNHWSLDDML